jgi:hypothetical protein
MDPSNPSALIIARRSALWNRWLSQNKSLFEEKSFYSGRIFKYELSTPLRMGGDFTWISMTKMERCHIFKMAHFELVTPFIALWPKVKPMETKQIARRWWAKERHPLQQVTEANQSDASQASSLG